MWYSTQLLFQPASFCLEHPVLSYLLVLSLKQTEVVISQLLAHNMTEVVLGPQDGLEDNQKYVYTVTAINTIEMTTSDEKIVCMYS